MLFIIFEKDMTLEDAGKEVHRKLTMFPDYEFEFKSRGHDLNHDDFFKKCVEQVEQCDIPMNNVIRDLSTGDTHSFDKVSTGTKTLWLLKHYNDEFIIESCYLGPNCYKLLVEISETADVYLYDNSNMLDYEEADECDGCFTDFTKNVVVRFGDDRAYQYFRGGRQSNVQI